MRFNSLNIEQSSAEFEKSVTVIMDDTTKLIQVLTVSHKEQMEEHAGHHQEQMKEQDRRHREQMDEKARQSREQEKKHVEQMAVLYNRPS